MHALPGTLGPSSRSQTPQQARAVCSGLSGSCESPDCLGLCSVPLFPPVENGQIRAFLRVKVGCLPCHGAQPLPQAQERQASRQAREEAGEQG